jgi:predicted dehydrogenase
MNQNPDPSRREFLKRTGTLAGAGTLAGLIAGCATESKKPVAVAALAATALSPARAANGAHTDTINVALIGAGGRGTGAAANALRVQNGPMKLIAMADVFDDRLKSSYEGLKGEFKEKVDVPEERRFVDFEGYKKAIDLLTPGKDIAIFATPPAFRWVHFKYAIEKGVNVFMEKPVTVDGPTSRRMFDLAQKAKEKGIKVGVGLMCRHCRVRGELFDRVQNGEAGDIIAMRCYRMHGPVASGFSVKKPEGRSELLWQIERFHSFLWASGGAFNDYYIHNIDECCWIKNAWPVVAQASGGRHYRGENVDQNFDNYSVEYTFPDGSKLMHYGRIMPGCHDQFASYAHGSKGIAVISENGHAPSKARIYKGQEMKAENLVWRGPRQEPDPYQTEWDDLTDAIRNDKPYNEVERGVKASLVSSMGRMAAHTGQVITYDQILNSDHEFAPGVADFKMDSAAPVLADASGRYPIPAPGLNKKREY